MKRSVSSGSYSLLNDSHTSVAISNNTVLSRNSTTVTKVSNNLLSTGNIIENGNSVELKDSCNLSGPMIEVLDDDEQVTDLTRNSNVHVDTGEDVELVVAEDEEDAEDTADLLIKSNNDDDRIKELERKVAEDALKLRALQKEIDEQKEFKKVVDDEVRMFYCCIYLSILFLTLLLF